MKRIKPAEELLGESYITKTEISRLLNVPWAVADTIYSRALDNDQRTGADLYPTKVQLKSVLKVTKLDYSLLEKQIKMRSAYQTEPHIDAPPKASSL